LGVKRRGLHGPPNVQKNAVILSAAKNLASISVRARTPGEILRCAQNDNLMDFSAAPRPANTPATLDKRLQSKQSGASGSIRILHFPKKEN